MLQGVRNPAGIPTLSSEDVAKEEVKCDFYTFYPEEVVFVPDHNIFLSQIICRIFSIRSSPNQNLLMAQALIYRRLGGQGQHDGSTS